MNKTIVLLSGVPSAKTRFSEIVNEIAWSWNCNSKNFLADLAKSLGWDGETRDDKFYKFISEFLSLANKSFDFERKYLEQKIRAFQEDESETKTDKLSGKEFSKFVLILHGVSKELVSWLQEDFGVYKIYVTRYSLNSNFIPESDFIIYEDKKEADGMYSENENFETEILNIINKLTERG